MKAISLWQPWASLIAVGAKEIETRHWPAPGRLIGDRIAIHAAKRTTHLDLVRIDPRFARALAGADLPLGAIVATAILDRCTHIGWVNRTLLGEDEVAFGNFSPGRYAWHLAHVRPLLRPVPWRGAQGFFDVDLDSTEGRRLSPDPVSHQEAATCPAPHGSSS